MEINGRDSEGLWHIYLDEDTAVIYDGDRRYPLINGEELLEQLWPCCRSSDKEGAHMKRTWKVLLVCVVAVAALAGYFFLLPAPAGGEDFQLLEVRQDGRDLTASSGRSSWRTGGYNAGASRFRWEESHWGISSGSGYRHGSWVPMGNPSSWWAVRALCGGRLSPARRGDPAGGGSEHPRILIHFAYR